jgi:hypothetical protein
VFPLVLSLSQQHENISGRATILNSSANGTITGTVTTSGRISLEGEATNDAGDSAEITSWTSTIAATAMSGGFRLIRRFGNAFGAQVLLYDCELVDVSRECSQGANLC